MPRGGPAGTWGGAAVRLSVAVAVAFSAAAAAAAAAAPVVEVRPGDDLAARVAAAPPGARIQLHPGSYHLAPQPYRDPTCGNCEDPDTPVGATLGLRLSGRDLRLAGAGEATVIYTHAGYGILIEDCAHCALDSLTITGGVRDPDGRATDAAVVVRRATASIRDCTIRDNLGDPAVIDSVVVGIIGIAGREGALVGARGNRILRNSWDGIALYRGARASIQGNLIDGVDAARGRQAGGGRGAGIGVTWDANATISGNLVRNYWKGIGVFVDAQALVRENVVEDVLAWGLSLWDAGKGHPAARFEHNAVYRTGACGVSITRSDGEPPAPGRLIENLFVATGQDARYDTGEPYCQQTAIARHAVPAGLRIEGNLRFANREPGGGGGELDLPDEEAFRRAAASGLARLARHPLLRRSAFLHRFGPGAAGRE